MARGFMPPSLLPSAIMRITTSRHLYSGGVQLNASPTTCQEGICLYGGYAFAYVLDGLW